MYWVLQSGPPVPLEAFVEAQGNTKGEPRTAGNRVDLGVVAKCPEGSPTHNTRRTDEQHDGRNDNSREPDGV